MRISDWSSDVCSSDLPAAGGRVIGERPLVLRPDPSLGPHRLQRGDRDPCALGDRFVAAEPIEGQRHRGWITGGYRKIGRASCRERLCQFVSISVVAVSLKTKQSTRTTKQNPNQ